MTIDDRSKARKKIKTKDQTTPRSKERYAALNPKRAVKNRQALLEVPYLDELSEKDKAFLNAFLEEFVITNFYHKGKKMHKTKKAKRELYTDNNRRNRDVYSKAASMGMLLLTPNAGTMAQLIDNAEYDSTNSSQEDYMITLMELKSSGNWEDDSDT